MMKGVFRHYDKILVAACIVIFLATAAMTTSHFAEIDGNVARNPTTGINTIDYESRAAQMPSIGTALWADAEAQSRGSDWLYDVFTPPVIYYNRETRQFTVTPPSFGVPVADRGDSPFDIELVQVRQEPFRIQLTGYVGDAGAHLATFELIETGETVVGRAGKTFDRGQFTLKSFDVRQTSTTMRDSMAVIESVAVAVINDERTGREEMLNNREMKMLPRLQAVLRTWTSPPEERVVREGGSIEVNGFSYQVVQLSLNPPQAVVSRRSLDSLGGSETRMLAPSVSSGPNPFSSGARSPSRSIFSSPK